MGRMRFSSRWNWVPKILVNQPLYINPLFVIQPVRRDVVADGIGHQIADGAAPPHPLPDQDRKSTRLNSSHSQISYAVFCLKKKKRVLMPSSRSKTTE